jgi:hypothetical protein
MHPSPGEQFYIDQQRRWTMEQEIAAIQAAAQADAYAAIAQAAHDEAWRYDTGGQAVVYTEHTVHVGEVATFENGVPFRTRLPISCGTVAGIVLGVEAGPIPCSHLWYRLVHTLGNSGEWGEVMPLGQTQISWRVVRPSQLGIARFFGPFADRVAVELSPRSSIQTDATQLSARWTGTNIVVGVTSPSPASSFQP